MLIKLSSRNILVFISFSFNQLDKLLYIFLDVWKTVCQIVEISKRGLHSALNFREIKILDILKKMACYSHKGKCCKSRSSYLPYFSYDYYAIVIVPLLLLKLESPMVM